jgi:DNA-binding LytR/AlgR family response regulator
MELYNKEQVSLKIKLMQSHQSLNQYNSEIQWINYCKVSQNTTTIFYGENRKCSVRVSLHNLEKFLPENHFIRIRRDILVNINKIKKIETKKNNCIVLVDGTILPISRRQVNLTRKMRYKLMTSGNV